MSKLTLLLRKNSLGTTIRHGVVARIQGLTGSDKDVPWSRDVVIPATRDKGLEVDVPAGRYRIQALLPSGEILQRDALLKEGEAETVSFESHSPREWLSWQQFDGARLSSVDLRAEFAAPATDVQVRRLDTRPSPDAAAAGFLDMPPMPGPAQWKAASARRLDEVVAGWQPAKGLQPTPSIREGRVSLLSFRAIQEPPPRQWIAVRAQDVASLIAIPSPWRDESFNPVPMELMLESGDGSRRSTGTLTVRDATLGGLLAYLGQGRLASARTLVLGLNSEGLIARAIEEKGRNPLGACAGAYVGLAVFEPGEEEIWDRWLPNLMSWFPWLPDGAIVHGLRVFKRPGGSRELKSLRDILGTAYGRGIPYFTAGVLHLRDLLDVLASEEAGKDDAVREMLSTVSSIASRLDPAQTFTTLRYAS